MDGWEPDPQLDLRLFFASTLGAEEVASGFIATLLEGRRDFLTHFLALLDPEGKLPRTRWSVAVECPLETGRIDIRLDNPAGHVIFIENKVRAGAVQAGQLLAYCQAQLRRSPSQFLHLVYLSPGRTGRGEVKRIHDAGLLPPERVVHVSWQHLAEFVDEVAPSDPARWFIASGFEQILAVIEADARPRWPAEGDRSIIAAIAQSAHSAITTRGAVALQRSIWPGKDHYQLASQGAGVTMWLDFVFDVVDEPPHLPRDLVGPDDRLSLKLRIRLRQSTKASRDLHRKHRWRSYLDAGELRIEGIGAFALREGSWFEHIESVTGLPEEIVETALSRTDAIVAGLTEHF